MRFADAEALVAQTAGVQWVLRNYQKWKVVPVQQPVREEHQLLMASGFEAKTQVQNPIEMAMSRNAFVQMWELTEKVAHAQLWSCRFVSDDNCPLSEAVHSPRLARSTRTSFCLSSDPWKVSRNALGFLQATHRDCTETLLVVSRKSR